MSSPPICLAGWPPPPPFPWLSYPLARRFLHQSPALSSRWTFPNWAATQHLEVWTSDQPVTVHRTKRVLPPPRAVRCSQAPFNLKKNRVRGCRARRNGVPAPPPSRPGIGLSISLARLELFSEDQRRRARPRALSPVLCGPPSSARRKPSRIPRFTPGRDSRRHQVRPAPALCACGNPPGYPSGQSPPGPCL